MTWFDKKFYTKDEVKQASTAVELPSKLQIGDNAKLWLKPAGPLPQWIPCVVVGVRITDHHAIYYDLAFQIGALPFYVVARDLRGYVTPPEVLMIDDGGGLVDADEVKEELQAMESLAAGLMGLG